MGRKNFRRIVAIGAIASATLLSGCAVGASGSGGSYDPDEKVTIKFSWWGGENRNQMTKAVIDAFEEEHPNITVETQSSDFPSYWNMIATQVAGGDAPDLMTMGGAYPSEYAGRGALLDLGTVSDYLDTSHLNEDTLGIGNFDGTQYTLPSGINALSVILNPTVFEQAGVELPDTSTWTWEDFAEISQQISDAAPDGTYGATPMANASFLDIWARQHGESLYEKDGSAAALSEETAASWFQYWLDLQAAGATPAASLFVEDATAVPEQSLFGTGRMAMFLAWSNFQTEPIGDDLILANLPGEADEPGNRLRATMEYGISSRTEHPEAAALLLDFLLNDTATVDALGTDRGVPANAELREHLSDSLSAAQQKEVDLIDEITASGVGANPPSPTGSSGTAETLTRLLQDVLFERTTPEAAAATLITEINAALQQ